MKMFQNRYFQTSAMGVMTAILPQLGLAAAPAAQQPNIIFIMLDDMGYRHLGSFGSTTIQAAFGGRPMGRQNLAGVGR